MKVLLWTTSDKEKSASARNTFYEMSGLLQERGYDVTLNTKTDLNSISTSDYDIVIINHLRKNQVHQAVSKWPNCHIGIFNPGKLGVKQGKLLWKELDNSVKYTINNVDFFIVTSFVWRDRVLPFGKRVYQLIDQEKTEDKPAKHHSQKNNLVIGYHGNAKHFKEEFFPHGANALKRLAKEYNLTLKVISNDVETQPAIEGIKTEFVEFSLATFTDEVQTFDIGVCPVFSDYKQLAEPSIHIRNPNRVITLLAYGIPSITSPIPQSCHDLKNGETTLFAVTEEGWYLALKQLIENPDLRNKIGSQGRKLVENYFSEQAAVEMFIDMLEKEMEQTTTPKNQSPPPIVKPLMQQRVGYWIKKILN